MSKNSIPAVRFCDFSDNWKSKKIGDLGSVSMNKRIFKDETSETGEVPFYKIGTFGSEPDSFITREKFEEYKSKYPYPEIGDILISASGSIGRTVEYQGEEAYFQDSNIVWLKHDERLNNSFLKQFYSIVKWEGIEGTTIKRLYNKNILETPISLPSPAEQIAIGSLFRTLDDLIASYKDNLTNYQSLKTTMLSKMFPKAGQTVPEIRLDGFEGEWEVKKLKNVVQINPKSALPEKFKYIDLESVVGTRINKIREEYKETAPSRAQRLAEKGDIFYQTVRPYQKNNYLFKLDDVDYVFSSGYAQLRPKRTSCHSDFLLTLLQDNKFLSKVLDRCTGTSYPAINAKDLVEISIVIPKVEEQQAIGSYFSNLDNLINSHQEKISQLETLKKKLLQDMFI
ncbi:restriction endonuclease subunit S [Streptococcus mitis]|jgi:type I restriction-modification system specificty subunit|uniref:restriction endonuclease subunit S n=1 Tax=Streptococcus mitis TaxID=28037 RepID=UPI00080B9943|nr:restriction endonuclease subunit S [Streptococcus mitis]MDU7550740.1 restriction endonuclease subunit S [Streptococcus mitis]